MNFHRQIVLAAWLFCISLSAQSLEVRDIDHAAAQQLQSYASEMAAKGYRVEYTIGKIDPRISRRGCENEITADFKRDPGQQPHTTLELACNDTNPWKLFVSAHVEIFGMIVVAANPIARGQILQLSDLMLSEAQVNQHRADIVTNSKQVEGMIAKRSIAAGQAINSRLLRAPELVDRGDEVTIIAQGETIAIRTTGTALSSGSLGQQIQVKNSRSERVIKARVIDRGQVAVTL